VAGQGLPLGVGDLGLNHVLESIEMMDRGGADICQPDISQVGGFTGILQIAQAASQRGKRVITHGYKIKYRDCGEPTLPCRSGERRFSSTPSATRPCVGRPSWSTSRLTLTAGSLFRKRPASA